MGFRWRFGNGHKGAIGLPSDIQLGCKASAECQRRQSLAEVEPGTTVVICCIDGEGPLTRRLAEMGFIPGTRVEVLRRAPLADPIEFELRGYLVSLRREEAERVRIRYDVSATTSHGDEAI